LPVYGLVGNHVVMLTLLEISSIDFHFHELIIPIVIVRYILMKVEADTECTCFN